jgi:hypothetical protein
LGTLKRICAALKGHGEDIWWSIAGGLIGGGIGLLFATLWLWAR